MKLASFVIARFSQENRSNPRTQIDCHESAIGADAGLVSKSRNDGILDSQKTKS